MATTAASTDPDLREHEFVSQSAKFVEIMLQMCGADSFNDLTRLRTTPARCIEPVIVNDYRCLTVEEKAALCAAFYSEQGVAYFIVANPDNPPRGTHRHPLFDIADQLVEELHLKHPLPHPLEGHTEAVSRFGSSDGTVKIYDLPGRGGAVGYREQAETAELFAMHHDGLGSGGTVETVFFYADSGPQWGGYTYFLNVPRLCLELAASDQDAFQSLFLPDALTIIRPRGKGAIKVTTPILFLNEFGRPQSFFRVPSGEYTIIWKAGRPPLDRARQFLHEHCEPFAPGTTFLQFTDKGHGCLSRNEQIAHGRTAFINCPAREQIRLVSRKWFMTSFAHSAYKHVPGMFIEEKYRTLYPEYFGPDRLAGEWRYDIATDQHERVN